MPRRIISGAQGSELRAREHPGPREERETYSQFAIPPPHYGCIGQLFGNLVKQHDFEWKTYIGKKPQATACFRPIENLAITLAGFPH